MEDVIKALHEALGTKTPLELMKKLGDMHNDQFSVEAREILKSEFKEIHLMKLAAEVQGIKVGVAVAKQVAHQRENPPAVMTQDYREYKADTRAMLDMAQAQGLERSRAHSGTRDTGRAFFIGRMDEDLKAVDSKFKTHRKARELLAMWSAEGLKDLPHISTVSRWIREYLH